MGPKLAVLHSASRFHCPRPAVVFLGSWKSDMSLPPKSLTTFEDMEESKPALLSCPKIGRLRTAFGPTSEPLLKQKRVDRARRPLAEEQSTGLRLLQCRSAFKGTVPLRLLQGPKFQKTHTATNSIGRLSRLWLWSRRWAPCPKTSRPKAQSHRVKRASDCLRFTKACTEGHLQPMRRCATATFPGFGSCGAAKGQSDGIRCLLLPCSVGTEVSLTVVQGSEMVWWRAIRARRDGFNPGWQWRLWQHRDTVGQGAAGCTLVLDRDLTLWT